jgi:hypothetical protein
MRRKFLEITIALLAIAATVMTVYILVEKPVGEKPYPLDTEISKTLTIGNEKVTIVYNVSLEEEEYLYSYRITHTGTPILFNWEVLDNLLDSDDPILLDLINCEIKIKSNSPPIFHHGKVRIFLPEQINKKTNIWRLADAECSYIGPVPKK